MREQILQELREEYAQRQQRNQQEESFRRMQAEAACLEIGQVMEERQNLVLSTILGVLDGKVAAEDLPERTDVCNKRLASLLRQHGFSEDYLDPVYTCPLCQDTGYVGEVIKDRCECFKQAFYARLYQRLGLSESKAQSFESFDLSLFSDEKLPGKSYSQRGLMNVIRQTCQQYAENYPNVQMKDMLLMGQSGLGKTFLMHAMAKTLIRRGVNVLILSAYKFLEIARKAYMTNDSRDLDSLMDADVLMIDDMGAEPLMENITIPQWFNLINERQVAGKGTVISTNLMEDNLKNRDTERVASRLTKGSGYRLIQFGGEDIRGRAQ